MSQAQKNPIQTTGSLTMQSIESHSLIREVIQNSPNHVISKHTCHSISPHSVLYSRPQKQGKQSISSNKIIDSIYKQLKNPTSLHEKLLKAQDKRQVVSLSKSKKPQNKTNSNRYQSNNISVSGLTSYNFRSVKAQNRLIFQGDDKAKLSQQLSSLQQQRLFKEKRKERRMKTCGDLEIYKQRRDAIVGNYPLLSSDAYLKELKSQQDLQTEIYGDKFKHYLKINQYMKEENASQSAAEFLLEKIKVAIKPTLKVQPPIKKSTGWDPQKQEMKSFKGRVIPVQRRRVILKYLQ